MCVRVLRGWQRNITGRRRGASPCAVGRVPSACLQPHSPCLPAAGGGKSTSLDAAGQAMSADSLGWGCFHLWMFPLTRRLLPPPSRMTVLCQNGCCSWHLPGSLFFFPEALNVSTPILAHLPAEIGGSSSQAQPHAPASCVGRCHAEGHHYQGAGEVMNCNTLQA